MIENIKIGRYPSLTFTNPILASKRKAVSDSNMENSITKKTDDAKSKGNTIL